MKQLRRSVAGFTLIEIMVVVFIIALLAALVAPQVLTQGDKAKVSAARTQIKSFEDAAEMFKLDNGRYPLSGEGLALLVPPPPQALPGYNPGGYMKRIPLDPWGHPYVYESDGHHVRIESFGADGAPGGSEFAADIENDVG